MNVHAQFDQATSTLTYIVYDVKTLDAIIIDPVLNFDQASGKISFESFLKIKEFVATHQLKIHYILETHAHADHLTSSYYLKKIYPQAKVAIGERIKEVQEVFKNVFHLPDLKTDGSQFDQLLKDGETIQAGSLKINIYNSSGHTPACLSFLINDHLFTGDALFLEDSGTGRCDFPKGSAKELYQSIKKLYSLGDHIKVYVGHDYQPNGRELRFMSTIGEEKEKNIQIKAHTSENEYVEFRTKRDKTLSAPKLLLPSIQVNINAGKLPTMEANGVSYLKMPLSLTEMPN
jgi:glyoxylase-like metal-dependent hydrolase (beta-lactamase superfamily II)